MTIQTALQRATEFLSLNGIGDARLDAEVLLAHVLRMRRLYLYVHLERELSEDYVDSYQALLRRRVSHVPVAQLTGVREFMGLDITVTPDVLTPRPETEILAQTAIELLGRLDKPSIRVADIGTGSGALAVSILKYIDNATVDAVDISPAALEIARSNAEKFSVADRLNFHEGDLFAPLDGMTFDAILSNPPYIPTADIDSLMPEVADHEPRIALDGGVDGLDICRRLLADAPAKLYPGGFLALEIGIDQAGTVKKILDDSEQFGKVDIIWDLFGIERIVLAYKK